LLYIIKNKYIRLNYSNIVSFLFGIKKLYGKPIIGNKTNASAFKLTNTQRRIILKLLLMGLLLIGSLTFLGCNIDPSPNPTTYEIAHSDEQWKEFLDGQMRGND